ncbi:MAG TPA: histidine kinase [Desulfobulbaceae bacterium]|nr:histidine kinase [Desulfobulbaceae bacterium]
MESVDEADCIFLENPCERVISRETGNWRQEYGNMSMLALVAEQDKESIRLLQKLCAVNEVTLYGAMFPGLIENGHIIERGMCLLPLPEATRGYLSDPLDSEHAVEHLVAWLNGQEKADDRKKKRETLFLIFDAMVSNVGTILEHMYGELGDQYAYAGVNAGSNTLTPQPCLVENDQFAGGRVLALLLPISDGGILEHGYCELDENVLAAASDGNLIRTINWRPALSEYRKLVQKHFGIEITRDNFYDYAVHYPFGILRANGELLVRIPTEFTSEGGIYCIGEVPPNSILQVLDAPAESLLDGAQRLADSIRALRWTKTLIFYCTARFMHLGDQGSANELEVLEKVTGPCHGALSLGEIGTTGKDQYPLFHNATIVALRYAP